MKPGDLVGETATPDQGKTGTGRPSHVPTDEARAQVFDVITGGGSQVEAARVLNISVATLKRHYAEDLAFARGLTGGHGSHANGLAHLPDDTDREYVKRGVLLGTPHTKLATAMGICLNTLKAQYADELAHGKMELTNEAAGHLVQRMRSGDTRAITFYLASQAGWSEKTAVDLNNPDGNLTPPKIVTLRGVKADPPAEGN